MLKEIKYPYFRKKETYGFTTLLGVLGERETLLLCNMPVMSQLIHDTNDGTANRYFNNNEWKVATREEFDKCFYQIQEKLSQAACKFSDYLMSMDKCPTRESITHSPHVSPVAEIKMQEPCEIMVEQYNNDL